MRRIAIESPRAYHRFWGVTDHLEQAKEESLGIRRKVAAQVYDIDMRSYMLSPHAPEFYGLNCLPHEPEAALEEYVPHDVRCRTPYDKSLNSLLSFMNEHGVSLEELVSRPDVQHAEISAMLESLCNPTVTKRNALLVTASPCLDCARMIVRYLPDLEALFFTSGYSCDKGLQHLASRTHIKIHGVNPKNHQIHLLENSGDFSRWLDMLEMVEASNGV